MSVPLLSLDKVKTLLNITDATNDERLSAALPIVTEFFENYTKRGLAYITDVVEEIELQRRVKLFRYPLEDVIVLAESSMLPAARVDRARGFVEFACDYNSWWFRPLAVFTYAGGYPEEDVPADLADAYARCVADYGGVTYTAGASTGGGAPLKSLGLGSGALTVSFDTAAEARSAYDTSAVPPILAPYLYVLDHYRLKDYV